MYLMIKPVSIDFLIIQPPPSRSVTGRGKAPRLNGKEKAFNGVNQDLPAMGSASGEFPNSGTRKQVGMSFAAYLNKNNSVTLVPVRPWLTAERLGVLVAT